MIYPTLFPALVHYWLGGYWDGTKDRCKNARLRKSALCAVALMVKAATSQTVNVINRILNQPAQNRTSWRRAV